MKHGFAIAGGLLAACGEVASESPPIRFTHEIIDRIPGSGDDCCDIAALGDLNGDGYADIVIGGERTQDIGLVWYEYPIWKKYSIAHGKFTTDGQVAEMDG